MNPINFYTDYFYYITLDGLECDAKGNPLFSKDEDKSTFLHEYIHFLQNILTVNGINYTENETIVHEYYIHKAVHTKKKPLHKSKLPIILPKNISEPYFKLREQFLIDNSNEISFSSIRSILPIKEKTFKNTEIVYYIYVKRLRKKNPIEIKLTVNHILECMAAIAERLVYPGSYIELNDNPYNVINELTKLLCPRIYNNYFFIFALCELSLNATNSVQFLIECLTDINDNCFPTDIHFLIQHYYNSLILEINYSNGRKNPYSANQTYTKIISRLLDRYNRLFSTRVPELFQWLNYIFNNSILLKNAFSLPITHILNTLLKNSNNISKCIYNIGSPIVITNNAYFLFPQKIFTNEIIYFSIYKDLIDYLALGKKRASYCCISKTCKKFKSRCKKRPFKNIIKSPKCYFADLAIRFGLKQFLY